MNVSHDSGGKCRRWIFGLLVSWLLSTGALAADGGPIRVVLRGYANPATIQRTLHLLWEGCRLMKGLEVEPLPVWPKDLLQRTPDTETEELFDGDRWARYTTTSSFDIDRASCQPVVWHIFHVDIIDGCRRALRGHKGSRAQQGDEVPRAQIFDEPVNCLGRPVKQLPDLSGLPVDDAGLGVRCVWSADIRVPGLKPPTGRRSGVDTCLYTRRPEVVFPKSSKPVVVRMRNDNRNDRGEDIGNLFPIAAELVLAEFSDGTAIPPVRFTREGIDVFLRQPNKQALGATR